MFSKRIAITCLATSMALTPATKVAADIGDGIVGGLVGGAVSGIIVNESAKHRERQRAQPRVIYKNAPRKSTRSYSPARAQVYEDQVALNYFGFPAGVPDGVSGRNTRNAVSQYQAHMSYPITGYMNSYERQFLISSFHRAQSSGVETSQLIAQRGGTRGLLHAYRDAAAGITSATAGGGYGGSGYGAAATAPAAGTTLALIPAPTPTPQPEVSQPAVTEPVAEPEATTLAALPNLMGEATTGPSLASHCSRVSLVTNSNGGFVTQATMTDPAFTLSEQFCVARTYSITVGEELASRVEGLNMASLEQQCAAFGPAMQPYVSALSLKPQEGVIADVSSFILQSGMSPAQLAGTARICLSVGYRTDDMNVAVGSGLLLTALGETGYAELLGHHLNEGFGTARRPDLAQAWYETGLDAVERSGQPVFVPANPDRTGLIRNAVFQANNINGKAGDLTGGGSVQPAASLPTFNIAE
ncbi:peptidoglycan-binding domain-containing protein [Roseovarius aestuarii]|uniref:Putative peptidoglycan binding domain protein n=1 Tax=Roseovarius aestuarii TaxID=475083 RepID=A0A1X7BQ73_9RHOB|nr:peptidoglycan-binding domain-containing protein [Roseovarius aestuarii]SMC11826.1 Putative peptidoglycan binding domain protein [Roseovarius aestuarii]